MKYFAKQRGFINGDDFAKAFLILLMLTAVLGALGVKGCDYIVNKYTVEVKTK